MYSSLPAPAPVTPVFASTSEEGIGVVGVLAGSARQVLTIMKAVTPVTES